MRSGGKEMKSTKKAKITPSSGNIFADVGLSEAEDRLLKAQLAPKIQQLIEQKGMSQAEIAPFSALIEGVQNFV
jgi:predicted XRE-type DNA-binding protein